MFLNKLYNTIFINAQKSADFAIAHLRARILELPFKSNKQPRNLRRYDNTPLNK